MVSSTALEAVLFYKAKPCTKKELTTIFDCSEGELSTAVTKLHAALQSRGLTLLETATSLELSTSPTHSNCIESLRRDELKKDIGKAGAETLAIILYRAPVARAAIDSIRGVNSQHILRHLLVRGLIQKEGNGRQPLYSPTTELLAHLGISKREDMPDFTLIMNKLDSVCDEGDNTDQ